MPLSGEPMLQAAPELVEASALNPIPARYRALPTSQGFGITNHPLSCNRRNEARLSPMVTMVLPPIELPCPLCKMPSEAQALVTGASRWHPPLWKRFVGGHDDTQPEELLRPALREAAGSPPPRAPASARTSSPSLSQGKLLTRHRRPATP